MSLRRLLASLRRVQISLSRFNHKTSYLILKTPEKSFTTTKNESLVDGGTKRLKKASSKIVTSNFLSYVYIIDPKLSSTIAGHCSVERTTLQLIPVFEVLDVP